ncbi:transferase [Niabella ginsenosidivorans]|uniref:Transferase n=1 Tax=Niabella ginsenosidivorans TaxID=1176587 RepID=A0A1A9I5F0_9BACT|nr:glycosyltransferase family 4 protein [Niabella ginsenosidivorans]ANH81891.1 transferase [Niabella ginsenosidivorans]
MTTKTNRYRIFTWHVHGSYLFYLSQGPFELYIPVKQMAEEGYCGRGNTFPFGSNVHEIPAAEVRNLEFDVVLFQSARNYLKDQYEILSSEQRKLPRIFLEHNTPHESAVNTLHWVDDPEILLVHVTHFNKLMWNNNQTPVTVIPHGVLDFNIPYKGMLPKGLVVINHLEDRGRTLGWDVYREVRQVIPLDLAGMGNGRSAIGEILHPRLPLFRSNYRFLFHPVRHTSLALAVCEAMMHGVPVVGLATTELVTVIENGKNGFIHTDIEYLKEKMGCLLKDPALAKKIGAAGRETARELFALEPFLSRWAKVFEKAIAKNGAPQRAFSYS